MQLPISALGLTQASIISAASAVYIATPLTVNRYASELPELITKFAVKLISGYIARTNA